MTEVNHLPTTDAMSAPTISSTFRHLHELLAAGEYDAAPSPSSDEVASMRNEVQMEMLRETLAYAFEHVPYYNEAWKRAGHISSSLGASDTLTAFPILRKRDVVDHRRAMVSRDVRVTSFRCTSGTTSHRLPLPICSDEVDAINRFGELRAMASGAASAEPLVLRVIPPVRRLASNSGGGGRGPSLTAFLNPDAADHRFDFDFYDHIIQCLLEEFPVSHGSGRVEVLWSSPPFVVRTLTDALRQRSFDPKMTDVREVVTSGGIVTKALCDYVMEHWNARLHAFYSLTEVAGSHARCAATGSYHFDLYSVPEFLHPRTLQPVEDGDEGVLVLTSLLPFQRAQPMIRYWTGDVFTKITGPCTCGFSGTSGMFRGREHECVDLSEILPAGVRPRLLGPADLLEVLHGHDAFPQFHKNPRFKLTREAAEGDRPTLTVESYPRKPSDEMALIQRVRDALRARFSPPPDEAFFKVRLVRRGALSSVANYYPDR